MLKFGKSKPRPLAGGWKKFEFLCTECDTLIEFTSYYAEVPTPKCPCYWQKVISINSFMIEEKKHA
jgi:hypothetical protein